MHPEVERLLDAATVEELVALTAGHNFWHTKAIARLGIPAMRVTDGPVGARGTKYDGQRRSTCRAARCWPPVSTHSWSSG